MTTKYSVEEVKNALRELRLEEAKKREEQALRVLACYMCYEQAEIILEDLIDKGVL